MIARANAGTSRSKLLVISIMLIAIALTVASRWYLVEGDDQGALKNIDCAQLHPTIAEVQGKRIELDRDSVCAVLRDLASAKPVSRVFVDDADDPWHYIARVRIQTEGSPWFLVFAARRSTGFRPELSLRQRREGGWAIVAEFEGEQYLRNLGLEPRIDRAKIGAPESREVRDQRQPL